MCVCGWGRAEDSYQQSSCTQEQAQNQRSLVLKQVDDGWGTGLGDGGGNMLGFSVQKLNRETPSRYNSMTRTPVHIMAQSTLEPDPILSADIRHFRNNRYRHL